MNRLNQSIAPQRFGERRDRNQKLERGLMRFRGLSGISQRSDWQRNGGQGNANLLKPVRLYCRASPSCKRVPLQTEGMMHADMIEGAARVRVAELPEPVKNQRSQPGLPCGAQFFAGSADVSIRGFAASALGERPSRVGRHCSRSDANGMNVANCHE